MTTTTRRLAGLVVSLALLVPSGAALAANHRPAGMSPAEYRAIMIRGQALNERYGLGVPAGMTAAQYRAMLIRGEALNKLYAPQPAAPAPTPAVGTVGSGFDWTDALIGAAIALGVVLLATGVTVGVRHGGHWHPHVRPS